MHCKFLLHHLSGKGEQSYPDILALVIVILVTVIVSLGVKNSVGFNNVLNVINLVVWVFIMIAGLFFVSGSNWDEGQFLPYGWSGVKYISNQLLKFNPLVQLVPLSINTEEEIALSCNYNKPLCPTGHAGCSHLLLCLYWV